MNLSEPGQMRFFPPRQISSVILHEEDMTERKIKSICVYCGSSDQIHPNFNQGARELGQELARRDIRLIYGGGKTGLMGAVAGGVSVGGWQGDRNRARKPEPETVDC